MNPVSIVYAVLIIYLFFRWYFQTARVNTELAKKKIIGKIFIH